MAKPNLSVLYLDVWDPEGGGKFTDRLRQWGGPYESPGQNLIYRFFCLGVWGPEGAGKPTDRLREWGAPHELPGQNLIYRCFIWTFTFGFLRVLENGKWGSHVRFQSRM